MIARDIPPDLTRQTLVELQGRCRWLAGISCFSTDKLAGSWLAGAGERHPFLGGQVSMSSFEWKIRCLRESRLCDPKSIVDPDRRGIPQKVVRRLWGRFG